MGAQIQTESERISSAERFMADDHIQRLFYDKFQIITV